ncbi:MAG: hypothetical protein ACXW1Z_19825 [Methylobacter sp.]
MSLVQKQYEFTRAIAQLILWCHEQGYVITFGDAYRDPRLHGAIGQKRGYGAANSCHKLRLAVDLNLILPGGSLAQPEDYGPLHDYWDTLGGSERIESDMNHFSYSQNGWR